MKWYKELPEVGDYVVVNITDVDKNSAYAQLEEYNDLTGLIHISEVSRSWVQDARKELSEGEKTVAQVLEIEDKDNINLSIKRVNDRQKREALSRLNKEQKAQTFLEQLGDNLGKDLDQTYEEIGFKLQEEFGSSFKGFEISVGEEGKLREMFNKEIVDAIQEIARNNIDLKKEKLEGEIKIEFKQGNGLERIKDTLKEANDETGIEIKYVSAPKYSVKTWGRTKDITKKKMDSTVETIKKKTQENNGSFEFSRI